MAIRVLHYVGSMHRGGMETFIMNLYRKIDREKIQFDFAVHGDCAGDFEEEIRSLGGAIYFFPHMRKNPLKYRKAWRSFWKSNKDRYIAFHMHTNSLANVIALQEAANVDIPVRIIHSHSSMSNKGKLQCLNDYLHRLHQKKLPRLATHLFACSDKAAEWLFGGMQYKNLKVLQVNNGIDTEKFKFNEKKRDDIRRSLGLNDKKVIGHIGAFLPVKNHRFIIDVVEQAYKKDSSVRCMLIGEGALTDEIKETVRQKGLEQVVVFMGVRDNVHELLSAMDVFLMPSLYEGLPVSLVEVQANGLPALISDSITQDVKLRDSLHYMSLSQGAELWAEKVLDIIEKDKHDSDNSCITEQGFNIVNTVSMYEDIILNGRNAVNE